MKTGAKKIIYVAGMIVLYIIALKAGRTGNVENIKDVAGHILQNQENVLKDDSVKKVALTFDDGPGSSTERLLDELQKRNVRATFFVVGEKVEEYPDTLRRMKEEGHIIGNHTYSHIQLTGVSCESAIEEVQKNSRVIEEITGERPLFLRPPYGECTKKMKEQLDMFVVLWDVDPLDWSVQNTDLVTERVLKQVKENDYMDMMIPGKVVGEVPGAKTLTPGKAILTIQYTDPYDGSVHNYQLVQELSRKKHPVGSEYPLYYSREQRKVYDPGSNKVNRKTELFLKWLGIIICLVSVLSMFTAF